MQQIYPPNNYIKDKFTIFLGGSIDMDNCENWQEKITNDLLDEDAILLNPRRRDFDNTQEQSINNEYFNEQVNWELSGLENCDLIVMYLLPGTLSPISLMEIGLFTDVNSKNNGRMIICCPNGFWRRGNVEIVSERYGIKLFDSYDELLKEIKLRINNRLRRTSEVY